MVAEMGQSSERESIERSWKHLVLEFYEEYIHVHVFFSFSETE